MAAVPHVSSAESVFDSSSAFPGEGVVVPHSVSEFSTSLCLDFQDKFAAALERSLPSYSSNFGSSSSSAPAWEHHSTNSDAHFFTSTSNAAAASVGVPLTLQPHLTTSSSQQQQQQQHEILSGVIDWQQMELIGSCLVSSSSSPAAATVVDGQFLGRVGGGLSASSPQQQLLPTPDARSGWNSVDACAFIPFANGNASSPCNPALTPSQAFAAPDSKPLGRAGSGPGGMMLLRHHHQQQPEPCKLPVVEAKVEASVDTCGTKSMQETSQVSITAAAATGKKKRCSSDERMKDASCVTSSGVKNGAADEVKGKRPRNGKESKGAADRSSSDNSASTSPNKAPVKENAKPPEAPKDYIHVRARRGQATDSHSLAERVRREKISERMKFLQDLVPGCNKVTGKAVMLDEIINYVQSLQRQVEFLSMKLAAVNPRLEFNIESLLAKEMSHGGRSSPTNFVQGPPVLSYSQQLQHAQHSAFQVTGLDFRSLNALQEAALRKAPFPVHAPDPYSDSISQTPGVWDGDLQNIVHMMSIVESSQALDHFNKLNTEM